MTKSSLLVTLGNFISLLAGFLSQVIIAGYFGTTGQMDAFLTAFVVPGYLQALLLTGLPFVMVPVFVRECERGRESEAWALAGTLFRLFGAGMALVALVCAWFAPQIISLTAPGLPASSLRMAGSMLTVLIVGLPFTAVGTLSIGIQNARGHFFWPSVAPALGTLLNISIVVFGTHHLGAMALAFGALAATIVQSAVSTFPILGQCWNRGVSWRDIRLLEMARLIVPIILFGLLGRATPVFERFFASSLPQGSISFLGYGSKITGIVQSLLGTGISAAVFPEMARKFTIHGKDGLVQEYLRAMQLTWVSSLPFIALSSVLAVPMAQVLFMRGSFTNESAVQVGQALPFLMGVVLCNILGNIIGRALYVQGKTFGFNLVGAVTVLFYPIFALASLPLMGFLGLAFAGLAVNAIAVAGGYYLLWREIGMIDHPYLGRYLGITAITTMATWLLSRMLFGGQLPWLHLVVCGLAGFLIYGLCLSRVDPRLYDEISIRLRGVLFTMKRKVEYSDVL